MKRPPLAVIGGGPSVLKYIDKLKLWKGDIWACGSAYQWIRGQGIKATFFNVDALPEQSEYAFGDEHAILASISDPSVFDAVGSAECFDLRIDQEYANHGTSAVTATPVLALEMGYTAVVYFGCESSFDTTTHAYAYTNPHEKQFRIWVQVEDFVYPTSPQYLIQADCLSEVLRTCPLVFREVSGGLLRALTKQPKWDIIAVNDVMHEDLAIYTEGVEVSGERKREIMPILNMNA